MNTEAHTHDDDVEKLKNTAWSTNKNNTMHPKAPTYSSSSRVRRSFFDTAA